MGSLTWVLIGCEQLENHVAYQTFAHKWLACCVYLVTANEGGWRLTHAKEHLKGGRPLCHQKDVKDEEEAESIAFGCTARLLMH